MNQIIPEENTVISRKPSLLVCPDCSNYVSPTAISCLKCGRVFQSNYITVNGKGWSWRIAWGIVMGYVAILVINAFFLFIFFVFFASLFANAVNQMPRR